VKGTQEVLIIRLLAHIPPEKQKEFADAIALAESVAGSAPDARIVMHDTEDHSLFCWQADWASRDRLVQFIRSDGFRALRGAIQVLGTLKSLVLAESQPFPEVGSES